jgi:intein/homing endonuclease
VEEKGRREHWDETVSRYVSFFSPRIPKADREATASELEKAIYHMEVMPSMRAMMTAGPALEKDNAAGYNPVVGETRIVTREHGNVEIQAVAGESVTVVNSNGAWAEAAIHGYGKQPTFNVKLKLNSNTEKTVECSANHRWLLTDGRVVPTSGLQRKDRVPFTRALKPEIDDDYPLGVRHGLIYGDGTATKSCKRVKGWHIRLCGDSRELLVHFEGYPVCYPPSFGGDPVVMLYDDFAATHALKELPPMSETESYLLGFIRGWMAADGSVNRGSGSVSLCTAAEGLEWLLLNSERLGCVVQGFHKQKAETNYGKRKKDSYVVRFSRSSMVEEDFLCSRKRENFKPLVSYFTIDAVEETGDQKEVFCAEVPDTSTFVLAGGIVTGNCSYIAVNDPRAFDEAMYLSMCGTGVGFSVERQYTNLLPTIAEKFYPVETCIKVRDSKIGWSNAFRQLISLLYSGSVPTWDLSAVRPAGSVLKTMGGRASGPEPLERLFKFTVGLFKEAAGRRLSSLECHDLMCMVGDVVVVGGVRRSAMLSLSNLSDDRMRGAKTGEWYKPSATPWRRLANNSVAYTEKPEPEIFIKEFLTLIESKSGERGIFNRVAAINSAKRTGRRKWEGIEFGTNPCLTKTVWITTANGPNQVGNLLGKKFTAVVDGEEHESTEDGFFFTGVKPVYQLVTTHGYLLEATGDHLVLVMDYLSQKTQRTSWKRVSDLQVGDRVVLNNHRNYQFKGVGTFDEGWLLGNLKGDGNIESSGKANLDYWGDSRSELVEVAIARVYAAVGARSDLKGNDQPQCNRTRVGSVKLGTLASEYGFTQAKQLTPNIEATSSDFHRGFLRGWFDADGSVQGTQAKGVSVRLSSIDLPGLQVAQRMLARLGVVSAIYRDRREAGLRLLPDGSGGSKEYFCQAQHELIIANDNLVEFASVVGFEDESKQEKLMSALTNYQREINRERFFSKVETVTYIGDKEVFDCSIPGINAFDANGLYVHNCGEINLRPQGFCNLSECVIRPHDTKATIRRKVRIATIIGCLQSTLTEFRYLRKEWQKNAEEERLLGVSLTGIMDNVMMSTNGPELAKFLDELREYTIEVATEWAGKLGIPVPAAITCIKPSGTVSQLVNCSPGIHARYARWIMRGTQEDRKSPVNEFMKAIGWLSEPELNKPNDSDVFFFALESPDTSVCRNDRTAMEQLETYKTYKMHWTEHNPSCFSGKTRFITDRGLASFSQFSDGEKVRVLGKRGVWKDATVRRFGKQPIWEVELERCGAKHTIETTASHLWPLTYAFGRWAGYKEKLVPTDKIHGFVGKRQFVTVNPAFRVSLDKQAVLHGITYGDGAARVAASADGTSQPKACQIYLCNDPNGCDSRKLSVLFEQAGYKPTPREDVGQVRFYGLPNNWKTLPGITTSSPEYLRGFISGWFAADGHIAQDGQCTLASSVRDSLLWLQEAAPKAGLAVSTQIGERWSKNFGGHTGYVVGIHKGTLDENFFVLEDKRSRFSPAKHDKFWKIVAVRKTDKIEPVFCVEEPEEGHFVLEGNILTHNCTIYVREAEWTDVLAWCFKHFDLIGGISFQPHDNGIYRQAPYTEITQAEYLSLRGREPSIDWARLPDFEKEDMTTAAKELACSAGACEM